MQARFSAVLFDFDGTLVDSSEGIFKSLIYAFEADGKPAPEEKRFANLSARRFTKALKICSATRTTKLIL